MKYWLMKSEPDECSIDDVLAAPGKKTPWSGVRNYQARNFMRDAMSVGDGVLFYHSSCAEPGIAGLAEVASPAYVDASQFDRKSDYFDANSPRNAPGKKTPWSGVRNYQARNFMRDAMSVGDGVLFYHSSCAEPGIAGLAEVASPAYVDGSQFDPKSDYYDAKSDKNNPRWVNVDVRALKKTRLVPLAELRRHKALARMVLLRPGNRLSITPVTAAEWRYVTEKLI